MPITQNFVLYFLGCIAKIIHNLQYNVFCGIVVTLLPSWQCYSTRPHAQKRTTCSGLMKTALNTAMLCCPDCSSVSTILFTQDSKLRNNNVVASIYLNSKTLFNPVFITLEQVVRFFCCSSHFEVCTFPVMSS